MTDKKRLTADDFDPKVMRLFDQYVHGVIDRRGPGPGKWRSVRQRQPGCWRH